MMVLFTSEDWQEKKRKEKKRKNLVEKCGIIDNTYNCFCQSNLIISSSHNSFSSKKQKKQNTGITSI